MLDENFDVRKFIELIDQVYDEIFIWDREMRVVYANNACYRHYNKAPGFFIGKTQEELVTRYHMWEPALDIEIFRRNGKPVIQNQIANNNDIEDATISVPIFNEAGEMEYLVQSVRDREQYLFREVEPVLGIDRRALTADAEPVSKDGNMAELMHDLGRAARTKAPILLLGETGAGKTFLAQHIHRMSERRDGPFVSVNMASLSPNVIESELFGYEAGAFTGASRDGKKGLFEAANGGTLFLDEIGDFPMELQAKFLHVVQDEEFRHVGGTTSIRLDVRLIYATNIDLRRRVQMGMFRPDLYQRINMMEFTVPPLRDRPKDLEHLIGYFLETYNRKYDRRLTLSEDVLEVFSQYKWPGNIRELSNVMERLVIISESDVCQLTDLPESFFSLDYANGNPVLGNSEAEGLAPAEPPAQSRSTERGEDLEAYRRRRVIEEYKEHPSSRKLAEALGISQSTANRWIQKYVKGERGREADRDK